MDESAVGVAFKLLAVIGLVLANGFFVAAEFSLVGMRRSRVEELLAQGHATAKPLFRAVDNLDANLAATQLGITISSLALGWIGEPALARLIEPALEGLSLPGPLATVSAHVVAVVIAFALITVFHIVLGELAPKSLAIQRPERTALVIVRPLGLVLFLFRPAIWVLNGLANLLLRAVGLEPGGAEDRLHSPAELKLLVGASKEAGLVDPAQQEVVERAFDIGERRVRAIMTPRLDVHWINAEDTPDAMLRGLRQSRHDQVVVARGTLDTVLGVLRKQDLLDLHLDGRALDAELLGAVREPLVVPDSATALQVLELFKNQPVQMALVVDEYGALDGLVTQTDLLEALAGEIPDRHGVDPAIVKRDDGSFLVDGVTPVDEAFGRLGLGKAPVSSDYRTLAGFVLSRLGRIPAVGDHVTWNGEAVDGGEASAPDAAWRLEVVDMDGHRVDKLLVSREPSPTSEPSG